MHVRAAVAEGGFSANDVKEIVLQQAIYCGVPAAHAALTRVETVLAASTVARPKRAARKGSREHGQR
jgi:alkylhydroperoxidase/carboxymuconolactone decarboxylase family protein YurZ